MGVDRRALRWPKNAQTHSVRNKAAAGPSSLCTLLVLMLWCRTTCSETCAERFALHKYCGDLQRVPSLSDSLHHTMNDKRNVGPPGSPYCASASGHRREALATTSGRHSTDLVAKAGGSQG